MDTSYQVWGVIRVWHLAGPFRAVTLWMEALFSFLTFKKMHTPAAALKEPHGQGELYTRLELTPPVLGSLGRRSGERDP